MPDEPHEFTAEEIQLEDEGRRRLEAEVAFRQSNILPMDAALNEGRFYGLLVKGDLSLNGWQRFGAILVGLPSAFYGIGMAVYDLWVLINFIRNAQVEIQWSNAAGFPGFLLIGYISYRFCRTGLFARRPNAG